MDQPAQGPEYLGTGDGVQIVQDENSRVGQLVQLLTNAQNFDRSESRGGGDIAQRVAFRDGATLSSTRVRPTSVGETAGGDIFSDVGSDAPSTMRTLPTEVDAADRNRSRRSLRGRVQRNGGFHP